MRLVSSREWISRAGPKRLRQTTLVFSLTRPGIVEFTLVRVAPDCTMVGRFRVRGKAAQNRVRFRGRIGRRFLRPGTYRILGRTVPARGRVMLETRLVIFGARNPTSGEVEAAQATNACSPPGSGAARDGALGSGFSSAKGSGGRPGKGEGKQATGSGAGGPNRDEGRLREIDSGVLGTRFDRAGDAVKSLHPLLYVLLGMAIALLGIAALPARVAPNYRVASLLEYRRGHIAFAGTMALVVVTVFYVLG